MSKTLIALVVVLVVALGLQVVGVVSLPVTSTVYIASYGEQTFGLWGYCDQNAENCTSVGLGYPDGAQLPNATYSVLTRLLIVHVVACGCTFIMLCLTLISFCTGKGYLTAIVILSFPSFLVSLLAFLVEVLLFSRFLKFAGWFLLPALVLNLLAIVLLCIRRRTMSDESEGSVSLETDRDDEKLIQPHVYEHSINSQAASSQNRSAHHAAPSSLSYLRHAPTPSQYVASANSIPRQQTQQTQQDRQNTQRSGHQQLPLDSAASERYRPQNSVRLGHPGQPPNQPAPQARKNMYAPEPVQKDYQVQKFGSHANRTAPPIQGTPGDDSGFDFEGVQNTVVPAGTEISGIEDGRSSFGPGVVALPRLRNLDGENEPPRSGHTPTGTPRVIRGTRRDDSQKAIVEYDQHPETPTRERFGIPPAVTVDTNSPRSVPNYSRTTVSPGRGDGSPARPHPQRNNFLDPNAQSQAPRQSNFGPAAPYRNALPPRISVNSVAIPGTREGQSPLERFMSEMVPGDPYMEQPVYNEQPPVSPCESDQSDFTSISQRLESQQQPPARQPQPAYHQAYNGQQERQSKPKQQVPVARVSRNDFVLQNNPDFSIGPRGARKRPGAR